MHILLFSNNILTTHLKLYWNLVRNNMKTLDEIRGRGGKKKKKKKHKMKGKIW